MDSETGKCKSLLVRGDDHVYNDVACGKIFLLNKCGGLVIHDTKIMIDGCMKFPMEDGSFVQVTDWLKAWIGRWKAIVIG